MDLDDELRRLFHDDRLDVAVKPGIDEEIVGGARRIRRRRNAVTGAFVVAVFAAGGFAVANMGGPQSLPPAESSSATLTTSPPTSTSASSPPPVIITQTHTVTVTVEEPPAGNVPNSSNVPAGPAGYGKLKLGMSQADALATGVLIQPSNTALGACAGYRSEGVPSDEAAVVLSPAQGVARITLPGFARTSAGIGAGSTVAELKAKYPAAAAQGSGLAVDMPGAPAWRYVFSVDSAQKISGVRMELKNSDCTLN